MDDIWKRSWKKAHEHKRKWLAKQPIWLNSQVPMKLNPVSNTAMPTVVKSAPLTSDAMVAELNIKPLCMEQEWAQNNTSPFPEWVQRAIQDLQAAMVIQEALQLPLFSIQVRENGET